MEKSTVKKPLSSLECGSTLKVRICSHEQILSFKSKPHFGNPLPPGIQQEVTKDFCMFKHYQLCIFLSEPQTVITSMH